MSPSAEALFLLLSLVLSELSHPQAKPLDFVCVSEARKVMNKVKELQEDLLPERRVEILQSLRMLAQDIHQARNGSQAECVLKLLDRLEHNINNYIHALTQLHTQNGLDAMKAPDASVQHVSWDLREVLQHFDRLISRKLEWLVSEMAKECEVKTTI